MHVKTDKRILVVANETIEGEVLGREHVALPAAA